uniref:Histone-lysine N-methyltransferase, H3 lysine-79 specific n=1 Tax=Globodera pallida TaxID=36090 RepID=A0A183BNH5_GLOPA
MMFNRKIDSMFVSKHKLNTVAPGLPFLTYIFGSPTKCQRYETPRNANSAKKHEGSRADFIALLPPADGQHSVKLQMDVVANKNATANNAEISVSSAASGDSVNRNVLTGAKSKNGHVHSHTMQMNGKSHQSKDGLEKKKPIRLQSPVGAQSVTWNWSADAAGSLIGIEVLDIIRLVICHYPEFDEPLKGRLENVDISNYDQVRAVDNEKALNKHYEAFSSQTYGETSFERMKMIIDEIKPTENDVFVDLGSGVGQLVIQMAGGSQVQKAVGIEIANLPADFARKLESEFKKWMSWFGRQFRPFQLKHGDFLNEEYRRLITEEATIIFVNNFAFQSDLELRIKRELLSDLKQGTRIISTKPYVPLNKQGAITDRQLNAYVPYYLHTINRKKLEMYFTQRNSSLRCKSSDVGSRRSSTPNSKTSNSRESSLDVRDKSSDIGRINGEDICFGPTTRRKWHEYVNDLEQQKKRKGGAGSSSTPDERMIELVNSIKEEPFAESSPPLVDTAIVSTPTNALILTSNTLHQQQNHSLIGSPKFVTNKHDGDGGSGKKQSTKRSYERKEKVPTAAGGKRGRPSKADKMLGTHTSPKMPRLSDDAKDGMEVMHQMTLSGKPIDPASILADMVEARRLTTSTNTSDLILPFPNLNSSSAGPSHPGGDVHSQKYAERYPGLTKFLEKMKGVYENMFDDFYASKRAANDEPCAHPNTTKDTPAKSNTDSSNLHFRSILDQTPVKRHLAEDLVELGSSGGSGSSGGWHPIAASDDSNKSLSRIEQCEKRVEGCRKRVAEKFQDFQAEIQQLNEEVDTLLNELRQQHQQRQIDSQTQQKQLQHQQILAQQQLIAAAQVQLAATQQSVAAQQHQPQSFQQQQAVNAQMNQALIAAVTNNQLELIINEIQAQYSRQLTAQQLLVQLSQLNFLGNIPPQDISTLQSIASGAALNEVVHQMSPVAAATLHSPLSSAGPQKLPPGPSPIQQHLATVVSNSNGSVGVQNFLSSLESLNNVSAGCSATPTNVCANLSAVAVEANSTSPTGSSQHHPTGHPTSLSLRQVSQNFPCPSSGITSSAVPTSSCSQSVSGASTSQLTRESTVAEVVAEVAALPTTVPRKPFRPRPARTSGVGGKRGGQNAQKQQTADDPKKQEEIERQIQDIVAKALEVDSAAKYAEKERKARGGEKRSKDKNGSAAAVSTSIPSTSATSTLPTTTSSALLDKALPPVIMQNFLTAAVAAQRKQLQQHQSLSCGVASGCVNDFQLHSIDGSSITQQLQQPIETQSPSSSTASISIQSHFPFTPSSISLAIQGAGLVGSQQFTASNSSMGTPQPPMTTAERNNSSPMFLHPKGSCSPPFISLNLPPTTSAALVTPPTNVVVKLIINEIQAQYSRQLTAQQLLVQLSQLNFLGNIPPQDISTLQSIASGAALNEVVHQMSPVAAATLHSPLSSAGPQKLPPGPSPIQQHLATVVSNSNGSVGVQNFLSSLESLNNVSAGCSATPTNVCANLSAVAVEANSTSPTGSSQHHPIGHPTSLSLRQVSQNFPCPSSGITSSAVPTSSCSQSVSGASTSQLTRESTVAEVVAEVAALPTTVPRKPFRPRPARTSGVGGKRGGQNAQKQQTADDPKKQEEIERQIQDIVAKALEVDSAAKYAEKERKARGGEKRSKDKNGSAAAVSTSIPSTSSTSTLPATTSSALLDKALPPVIMQNFLTAAVAAQRKQLQQHQSLSCGYANDALSLDNERNWKSLTVASGCVNDFQLHSIDGSSITQQLQQPIETQSPSSSTASISIQSHFPFTPSSISLAIQGAGLVGSQQFTASNSSMGTPQPPMTTTERNNSSPMFLHPKGSCSPPFISLNLPPTTSAALVTPPTNVVVKVEPKLPPISTSGGGCNNGLLSAPPSTMP